MKKNIPAVGVYPFWFWNGEEQEPEIIRQMAFFAESNCRGVAIHSRTGNRTEYLSSRWFDLLRLCCREALRLGLKIWLYDEDGFPSGNAGHRVQQNRRDLEQQYLTAAYDSNGKIIFEHHSTPRHVDTLNRESCARFLEFTHRRYEEELSEFFGNPIEAVYTDDESYLLHSISGCVYSPSLTAAYPREYNNRTIDDDLPLVFDNRPDSFAARKRYFGLAQKLFLANFIRPQRDWCQEHGIIFLGHLCGDEGPLLASIRRYNSAMPYLRLEDVPSIDDFLCEMKDQRYLARSFARGKDRILNVGDRFTNPLFLYKSASSVANQFSGGIVSAETLTFLTWEIPVDFLARQMLFELGMGVNLMTHHACYYTLGRGTKNDCPPSYGFQQPFAPVFAEYNRIWTRLAEILSSGRYAADTLVLYPNGYCALTDGGDLQPGFVPATPHPESSPRIEAAEHELGTLLLELTRRHVQYDLGDETLLENEGAVDRTGRICLGDGRYRTVIVPSAIEPGEPVKRLLADFVRAGGSLCFADQLPDVFEAANPGTDCAEILVHSRRLDSGEFIHYWVNLSDRALSPRFDDAAGFRLADPIGGRVYPPMHRVPEDFTLPRGAACLLLPVGETAGFQSADWPESVFRRGDSADTPLVAEAIVPENPNVRRLAGAETVELPNEPGTKIYWVTGEFPPPENTRDETESHPCDPCYRRYRLLNGKDHTLRFEPDTQPDFVYIEGEFPDVPQKLQPGDLSRQGYPHYWGSVRYEFRFNGRAELLIAELAGGGAEVFINGTKTGVLYGNPARLAIGRFCSSGENHVTVRLYNTAQNFVSSKPPVPFGLSELRLQR